MRAGRRPTRTCRARSSAVAALVAVHANAPAATCVPLAQSALAAGRGSSRPDRAAVVLAGHDRADLGRAHARGAFAARRRRGREPATRRPGACSAMSLPRAWLRCAAATCWAPRPTRARRSSRPIWRRPPLYRELAPAILVTALAEQGDGRRRRPSLDGFAARRGRAHASHRRCWPRARRLRLAQGRPAEALADILAAGRIVVRTGDACPRLPGLALAGARWPTATLGEREAACAWRARRSRWRALRRPRELGVALRTAGVAPAATRGERCCARRRAAWSGADVPLERTRALAELGALRARGNRRAEARELLREALDWPSTRGRAARRARRGRAAGDRRAAAAGAAERRRGAHGERAARRRAGRDGRTNREIAQALFVTARTVEGHLTRVFGKLDLSSRDELPTVLRAPR